MRELSPSEVEGLSPGVRELVVALRAAGFETTDSGDGSNYEAGMGCAVPFKMVFVVCSRTSMCETADRLARWCEEYGLDWPAYTIEASYKPSDGVAGVLLSEITDEHAEQIEGIIGLRPSGLV